MSSVRHYEYGVCSGNKINDWPDPIALHKNVASIKWKPNNAINTSQYFWQNLNKIEQRLTNHQRSNSRVSLLVRKSGTTTEEECYNSPRVSTSHKFIIANVILQINHYTILLRTKSQLNSQNNLDLSCRSKFKTKLLHFGKRNLALY